MPTCQIDETIERKAVKGFKFPLGVYPVEPMTPLAGYSSEFEPADNEEEMGDWEAWPDQYVFDIVVPIDRIEALWHQAFAMMPGRVYPIIDYIGHDAYREIDPFMSYEPIGKEKVIDAIRTYRPFFFEDGMVGFGAVTEDPFFYVFIDEHKIMTIRVETKFKEQVEQLLAAFDLESCDEPAGADSASHEHRAILVTSPDRPDLLTGDEIVERMRDYWRLILNVDPDSNVDDEGNDLGITPSRCLVRYASDQIPDDKYAEVYLTTDSLRQAEEIAQQGIMSTIEGQGDWLDVVIITADRLTNEAIKDAMKKNPKAKPFSKKMLTEHALLGIHLIEHAEPSDER